MIITIVFMLTLICWNDYNMIYKCSNLDMIWWCNLNMVFVVECLQYDLEM